MVITTSTKICYDLEMDVYIVLDMLATINTRIVCTCIECIPVCIPVCVCVCVCVCACVCDCKHASRGWNYSQTSDIFRGFVPLVPIKIDILRQTVWTTNANAQMCTHNLNATQCKVSTWLYSTLALCVALQLRGTGSHVCAFVFQAKMNQAFPLHFFWEKKMFYGRSKVENGRTNWLYLD